MLLVDLSPYESGSRIKISAVLSMSVMLRWDLGRRGSDTNAFSDAIRGGEPFMDDRWMTDWGIIQILYNGSEYPSIVSGR